MKNSAITVLCTLYRQCGETIEMMIDQSDLNELLKKTVKENLQKEK